MSRPAPQSRRCPVPLRRWCVLIAVPPSGFGSQLAVMHAWLDQHCGPLGWATAPAGTRGVVNDAIAFYFSEPAAARAFVARFSCGYRNTAYAGL